MGNGLFAGRCCRLNHLTLSVGAGGHSCTFLPFVECLRECKLVALASENRDRFASSPDVNEHLNLIQSRRAELIQRWKVDTTAQSAIRRANIVPRHLSNVAKAHLSVVAINLVVLSLPL
jgi:hypothetical protein